MDNRLLYKIKRRTHNGELDYELDYVNGKEKGELIMEN